MTNPRGGNLGDEGFTGGPALSLESTQDIAMEMKNMQRRVGRAGSGAQVITRQYVWTEMMRLWK